MPYIKCEKWKYVFLKEILTHSCILKVKLIRTKELTPSLINSGCRISKLSGRETVQSPERGQINGFISVFQLHRLTSEAHEKLEKCFPDKKMQIQCNIGK